MPCSAMLMPARRSALARRAMPHKDIELEGIVREVGRKDQRPVGEQGQSDLADRLNRFSQSSKSLEERERRKGSCSLNVASRLPSHPWG